MRSCLLSLMVVYNSLTASAVSFSHNAGKYDKDEEADDEIQGKNQTKYDRGKEGNWTELTLAKTSGTVTRDREKIGQWLIDASSVTIPETIAGRISAQVPFLFLKWRMCQRPRQHESGLFWKGIFSTRISLPSIGNQ